MLDLTSVRSRRRSVAVLAAAVAFTTVLGAGSVSATPTAHHEQGVHDAPDFGPNVTIIDPSMPTADIQAILDELAAQQVDDEMGSNRRSVLFLPGDYGSVEEPLQAKVGYYTEIAGLGAQPTDVTVNGKLEVYNRCLADGGTSNCLALVNFWRTISNLSLEVNAAGAGRVPRLGELLGGLPGSLDAPPRHFRREPLAHGLLHRRPAVRQRWLHRRLPAAVRGQRLAAAVAHPQQRDRRMVERRVEPGVLGRRGRAGRRGLPEPAVHDPRARRRSAGRSRTSMSTTQATGSCACPRPAPTVAGSPGPAVRHPVAASRSGTS